MDASLHAGSAGRRWREAGRTLAGRLGDFGRRVRGLALVGGVLWAAASVLLALLAAAYVDLLVGLPSLARVIGVAAAIALGPAVLIGMIISCWRRGRLDRMARLADRLANTGGQVAAGLDLTELPSGTPDLTLALAGMSVERAGQIVAPLPEERVVPLRPVGRAVAALGGALAVLLAIACFSGRAFRIEALRLFDPWGDHPSYSRHTFRVEPGDVDVLYGQSVTVRTEVGGPAAERVSLVVRPAEGEEQELPMFQERGQSWRVDLTEVTDPLTYWVTVGKGRSHRYHVGVIYTPRIESLTVRIAPPVYTNLPARDGKMPEGGISGLPGTQVALTARSNRPLSAARIRLKHEGGAEEVISGGPIDDGRTARAEFTIRDDGEATFWIEDERGERSTTTVTAPVFLLADHAPAVRIVSPKPQSFATPDVPIRVTAEADDDYGVSALSLYRSLNGSRHRAEPLMVPIPMERHLSGSTDLLLARYGLEPGDVISLFARVEDSDPAGAKGAESAVTRLTIISRELYERLLRAREEVAAFQQKYEEAARRLESLRAQAEELQETARREGEGPVSEEMQQGLNDLAEELARAAERTDQAAERETYALDKDLGAPLRELAEKLRQAERLAREAAGAKDGAAMRQALSQAAQAIAESGQGYEESVMQPLERFTAAFDLLEMELRFIDLAQRQRDLAERMQELRGQDTVRDPQLTARMRDLRTEQAALAEELGTVVQGIRDRAAVLPERPEFEKLRATALEFADAVDASAAGQAMADSEAGLQANRGSDALAAATRAADELESFIGRCRSQAGEGMQGCQLAFGPARSESAGMTVGQMLQTLGLSGAYGRAGAGAGSDGYSMRTTSPDNVGVYGPNPFAAEGRGEPQQFTGAPSVESEGGQVGETGVTTAAGTGSYDAQALTDIPPRQRAHVRAYMQQVADELAAGRVLRPPRGGPAGEEQEENR